MKFEVALLYGYIILFMY